MGKKSKLKRSGHQKKIKQFASRAGVSLEGVKLQLAIDHHRAGRLPKAEALFRQILLADPKHLDALIFLGIVLNAQGRLDEAAASYRQALILKPDYAGVHSNLGNVLKAQGKLDEAGASYRRALGLRPDFAEVHYNLGNVLKDQGKLDDAVASYRQALSLKPDYVEAHRNLGLALDSQGKFDAAIASYRQTLRLKPNCVEIYLNLGNALSAQGKLEDAVASYRQAINLKPDFTAALNNLGNILKDQGKLDEAIASYRQAFIFNPNSVEAYSNLGIALMDRGMLEKAVDCLRKAVALNPDFAPAHNNLGIALKELGHLEEAIASFRRAVTLKPDFIDALNNLGALREQGKPDEAIACLRHAISLKPDFFIARSNLLFCMNFLPDQTTSHYLTEARNYGRQVSNKVNSPFSKWPCAATPERLRIGFVSGDLRTHPVGYFLENMLANVDPDQMELIAYSTHHLEDALSTRIRPYFAAWKSLLGITDETAASMIHDDGVHILLDLSGHTLHNRLPVFAWKPAPVQATWLGYFASTGLAEIDYLLADPVSVPESFQEHFTEKIWYLPETRLCFSPPGKEEELPTTPLPALRNGYITFGCFQNLAKLNDAVFTAWAEIFRVLPRARLQLQSNLFNSPQTRDQMLQRFHRIGIAPERLIFKKYMPRIDYLKAYADIDIILDTFPFPGGTTTCEALWMGVPTVTLAGKTMLARQGASLLSSADLADWIAIDEKDYARRVVAHASDTKKLAQLRTGLRRQVLASALFDTRRFARNFEEAMSGMWRRFREGIG